MDTRTRLHELIDQIADEELLVELLALLQKAEMKHGNELWMSLSPEKRAEIEDRLNNSYNQQNRVSHREVMERQAEWKARLRA
jgi:hypothetical protein